mmetsp:Transcript_54433/g.127058  ORF Transcript_54433/g.127058 Transcript_54433/m.127058 type:complete len:227 (+) Transcript_54433:76-756(+)
MMEWQRKCRLLSLVVSIWLPLSGLSFTSHAQGEGAQSACRQYAAALRGGARVRSEGGSSVFRHLASVHTAALSLRRRNDLEAASNLYSTTLHCQKHGLLPRAPEIARSIVAAHASLNLGLIEQARQDLEAARQAFQAGVTMVQQCIKEDFKVRAHGIGFSSKAIVPEGELSCCLRWLATLLVAWALMEVKSGNKRAGLFLAKRAVHLDASKAPLLKWKILQDDSSS